MREGIGVIFLMFLFLVIFIYFPIIIICCTTILAVYIICLAFLSFKTKIRQGKKKKDGKRITISDNKLYKD